MLFQHDDASNTYQLWLIAFISSNNHLSHIKYAAPKPNTFIEASFGSSPYKTKYCLCCVCLLLLCAFLQFNNSRRMELRCTSLISSSRTAADAQTLQMLKGPPRCIRPCSFVRRNASSCYWKAAPVTSAVMLKARRRRTLLARRAMTNASNYSVSSSLLHFSRPNSSYNWYWFLVDFVSNV